jgi:hypothetical protein
VVIKVLFVILILSTAALVAVGLAIHFRVKRHLHEGKAGAQTETPPKISSNTDEESMP